MPNEEEKLQTGDTLNPSSDKSVPELNNSSVPDEEEVKEMNSTSPDLAESSDSEDSAADSSTPDTPNPGEDFVESLNPNETVEPAMTEEQKSMEEELVPQSQVNEIVGRTRVETRDKTRNDFLNRYGATDELGMDEIVSKSQKYDMLREDYDNLAHELSEMKIKLAMYDSGIDPKRYDDARAVLQFKNVDITPDSILAELETHPEWRVATPATGASSSGADSNGYGMPESSSSDMPDPEKEAVERTFISRLGNEPAPEVPSKSERDIAMEMFRR